MDRDGFFDPQVPGASRPVTITGGCGGVVGLAEGAGPVKLIKTVALVFRQGSSDKVYEVDLAEVGPDRFVVNFRYGRRGSRLQSGSKTAVPVPRLKADQIYDDLVHEKVAKGYQDPGGLPDAGAEAAAPGKTAAGKSDNAAVAREATILARLQGDTRFRTDWKLTRVIWRAGELRLRAAEPLLWPFLSGPPRPARVGAALRTFLFGEKPPPDTEPPAPATGGPPPVWSPWGLTADAGDVPNFSYVGLRYRRYQKADREDEKRLFVYITTWALGRCGTRASIPRLRALTDDPAAPPAARRMALESIRLLMTPDERAEAARRVLAGLPPGLAEAVSLGGVGLIREQIRVTVEEAGEREVEALLAAMPDGLDARFDRGNQSGRFIDRANQDVAFRSRLREWMALGGAQGYGVLADLYWIDDETTRPALLAFLRDAPIVPNLARVVRYLFKVAELREDAAMLGLLTYRFETSPPRGQTGHAVFPFPFKGTNPRYPVVPLAYTGKTRNYFRRRAWRILLDRGRLGSPEYVRMAEQMLRNFRDDDARPVIPGRSRKQAGGKTGAATIDRFGGFTVLNRILYWDSPRYGPTESGFFVCKGKYLPGDPPPATREEAFRGLWDRAPDAILRLCLHAQCTPVHEFAARALRANPGFCRGLDLGAVRGLAGSPFEPTARLGLELAVERFDPENPDPELVLVLADSPLADARLQAAAWARAHWGTLRRDPGLVVGLVASPRSETRAVARDLLRKTALPESEAETLVARLVARLLGLGEGEDPRAADVAETMLLVFRTVLRRIGEPVIRDLLAHPLANVQRLAGDIVLGHDVFSRQPPPDVFRAMLASPHEVVRAVAVKLVDQFDDDRLTRNADVLVWLTRHPLADLRENVRATVRRLAASDRDFGRRVAGLLVDSLLMPGAPEGVPGHTARVLREDLRDALDRVPAETVMRLLESRSRPAQEVGGLLLPTNVDWQTLAVDQLVRLAGNDILSVREAVWQIGREHPERLAADLRNAYRLADARWEDSRLWAFALFRDRLADAEWPPEALVGLCDSTRPDVQRFGREMIGRLFRAEHGEQFALELSEHPDPDMQAYAGQFLDRFAPDDPAHLRRLQFFCTAVLTRVNKGRVAKERAFAFLERAARSGPDAAAVVAEVLTPLSATAAVGDRARAVELMTFIHETYPAIDLPIRVRPAEVRRAV